MASTRPERDETPGPIAHGTPDVDLAEAQLALGRPELAGSSEDAVAAEGDVVSDEAAVSDEAVVPQRDAGDVGPSADAAAAGEAGASEDFGATKDVNAREDVDAREDVEATQDPESPPRRTRRSRPVASEQEFDSDEVLDPDEVLNSDEALDTDEDLDFDEDLDSYEDFGSEEREELAAPASRSTGAPGVVGVTPRVERGSGRGASVGDAALPASRAIPGNRLVTFLQGSWRELQRVQWPDRRQVMQATGVVIGFVIVAGVFLGVADFLAGKLVNLILK